ncbi:MAG TPA: hypothetical protein VMU38_03620 [Candidatus Binatia bacterium]|nr:hypothetical protein [Candidatus Binatia bacterium]
MHWLADWAWGVPLIVLTLIVHSLALFGMRHRMIATLAAYYDDEHFSLPFALAMGVVVLFATVLLAAEAALWGAVYVAVGTLPDWPRAMLYSLEAMTTFGHSDVYLTADWQFLGALEALNGVILIGLTTAFIYSLLRGAELRRKHSDVTP